MNYSTNTMEDSPPSHCGGQEVRRQPTRAKKGNLYSKFMKKSTKPLNGQSQETKCDDNNDIDIDIAQQAKSTVLDNALTTVQEAQTVYRLPRPKKGHLYSKFINDLTGDMMPETCNANQHVKGINLDLDKAKTTGDSSGVCRASGNDETIETGSSFASPSTKTTDNGFGSEVGMFHSEDNVKMRQSDLSSCLTSESEDKEKESNDTQKSVQPTEIAINSNALVKESMQPTACGETDPGGAAEKSNSNYMLGLGQTGSETVDGGGSGERDVSHEFKNVGNHKCLIYNCRFSCRLLKDLKCHVMSVHLGLEVEHCDICNEVYSEKSSLLSHMKRMHYSQGRNFRCPFCPQGFKLKISMQLHLTTRHSVREETPCKVCGKVFPDAKAWKVHAEQYHKKCMYVCDQCPERFPHQGQLLKHEMMAHNATMPYMCEVCGLSFMTKNRLTRHSSYRHPAPDTIYYSCTDCGRRFLERSLIQSHVLTHVSERKHKCTLCGRAFKKFGSLKAHMRIHIDSEQSYVCSYCNHTLRNKQQLKRHEETHFRREKTFFCDKCSSSFYTYEGLQFHMRRNIHGSGRPERNFPCKYCAKRFETSMNLARHEKFHTDPRPFACQGCKATFRRKSNLTVHRKTCHKDELGSEASIPSMNQARHEKVHTGPRPFACQSCEATFQRKSNLTAHRNRFHKDELGSKAPIPSMMKQASHEKVHTDPRPFACQSCEATFQRKSNLTVHRNRCHKDELVSEASKLTAH